MADPHLRIRDAVDERGGESGESHDPTRGGLPTSATAAPTPTTPVPPGQLRLVETSDLQDANDDGSVTIEANTERELLLYENRADHPFLLHFLGAADALDVQYVLRVGQEIVFTSESPVGTITNPFVFADYYGGPMAFARDITYSARNNTGSSIDLAGRMGLIEPLQTEMI